MIVLIACIAVLSGLLVGYNTAVIAPVLDFVTTGFALGPVMQGVVVSSVLLGGFAGSLLAGGAIRRFGERPMLFATAALFVVGPIGSAMAQSVEALLLWRTVAGLGVGAATAVAPLYVGETAPARSRGALVSFIQLAITVGILASYLAGTLWTPTGDWRLMLGVGAIPGVLMLLAVAAVPESPRWYLLNGRVTEAQSAHLRLTGGQGEELPARIDEEADADWRDLFGDRNLMVLVVAAGLFVFANLSGIDAILYYAPAIFAQVGIGGTLGPILATAGIGAVNVLATVVAMVMIDRLGRRPLLIGGLVPMALSLLALTFVLPYSQGGEWAGVVALVCLGLFVTAFAVSLGPLPYVLASELFPLSLRGPGIGIASAMAWATNVLVSLTFPVMLDGLGVAIVFGLYGLVSFAALVFVFLLVPETRGRSLELIEANLARGRSVRDLGEPLPAAAGSKLS